MKLSSHKKLIKALPVRQQSFTSKLETWEQRVSPFPTGMSGLFSTRIATVSREDVFNLVDPEDLKSLIYATIVWGYPRGMRGNHFFNIHANIDDLEAILLQLLNKGISHWKSHWDACFSGFRFPGLKLSTYSKLLYFLNIQVEDYPALILDNVLIEVFRARKFDELMGLNRLSYDTAPKHYVNYLKIIHEEATLLGVNPEQLEMFLFMFGPVLKP